MKSHQICKNCNFFQDNGPEKQGICREDSPKVVIMHHTDEYGRLHSEEVTPVIWTPPGSWCGKWEKAE